MRKDDQALDPQRLAAKEPWDSPEQALADRVDVEHSQQVLKRGRRANYVDRNGRQSKIECAAPSTLAVHEDVSVVFLGLRIDN